MSVSFCLTIAYLVAALPIPLYGIAGGGIWPAHGSWIKEALEN